MSYSSTIASCPSATARHLSDSHGSSINLRMQSRRMLYVEFPLSLSDQIDLRISAALESSQLVPRHRLCIRESSESPNTPDRSWNSGHGRIEIPAPSAEKPFCFQSEGSLLVASDRLGRRHSQVRADRVPLISPTTDEQSDFGGRWRTLIVTCSRLFATSYNTPSEIRYHG